ncbi:hypothetical protein JIG36_48890 [Actinoplanes sp. LDG1-06]|uniref:Uncharacterized protein n=1 Tax=Paractinoplanes ovalisporus TaxID=2810368 RepID=A0ABS2AUC8_9ACTN|nr:hypothetical protein [Actinoplanes ovalisporus]MBM2623439.1 hypothetical protein [Actinoplanes ovalisporus]
MKKARTFTMLAMGLVAGATMAAGPAMAADSAGTPAAKPSTTTKAQKGWDRDRVVGYFRSLRACEKAGRIGEFTNRWDDYDCDRVRFGFKRGLWALEVQRDWRGGGHGHGPWGNGHGGHGGHGGGHGHGHGGPRGHR